ncbi:hypothetical protein Tco_1330335 [Tanacetum coccineum]
MVNFIFRQKGVLSLTAVAPSQFAKNVVDSDDAPSDKMKLFWLTTQLLKSKVLDEPSDPLDIDSDPDIHGKFLTPLVSFLEVS